MHYGNGEPDDQHDCQLGSPVVVLVAGVRDQQ